MLPPHSSITNYKITVSYDGRNYFGWQRHGDKPTIQYALERAVEQVYGQRVVVNGSGRTDRGAHANGQVASVELPTGFQDESIKDSLNDVLEGAIRIVSVVAVPPTFHARDSAVGKHYRYLMWNDSKLPADRDGKVWHVKTPLDVEAMIEVCPAFEGKQDFASFATRTNFKQKSTTRIVEKVMMKQEQGVIIFDICADGFLYKMVRNIVRAIVKVGEGRYSRDDLYRIINAKDRKAAPGTAPSSGLYLERVFYSEEEIAEYFWKE